MSGPPQQASAGSLLKFTPRSTMCWPWYMSDEPCVVTNDVAPAAVEARSTSIDASRITVTAAAALLFSVDSRFVLAHTAADRIGTVAYCECAGPRAGTRIWSTPRAVDPDLYRLVSAGNVTLRPLVHLPNNGMCFFLRSSYMWSARIPGLDRPRSKNRDRLWRRRPVRVIPLNGGRALDLSQLLDRDMRT